MRENIPIIVKNTFNPEGPGTVILNSHNEDGKPIKGISSIGGTALITVTGLSMVGVIGVNRRIFTALAQNGISVFMVSQASSETQRQSAYAIRMPTTPSECSTRNSPKKSKKEPCSLCMPNADSPPLQSSVRT